MAAAMPPMWTERWALPRRRSSLAARTAVATATLAQKACTETRGAGEMYSSAGVGVSSRCSSEF